MRHILAAFGFIVIGVGGSAFSQDIVDAPELARRGPHSVGVRTFELANPGQPDILKYDAATGKAPVYDRPLTVEVWYPADAAPGQKEQISYKLSMPGNVPTVAKSFETAGRAIRDAAPAKSGPYPLVIVSHGYPGSRFFLSYLTENLASKGYVVAAIDHTDSVFGAVKPFPSTLLNRAPDQLFVLEEIPKRFAAGVVDGAKAAIVGYSMGGYGALASAGAGYSAASAAMKVVPGGYLQAWGAGNPAYDARRTPKLKAVVAISPWGGLAPFKAWDEQGLAGIRIPSLFIVGDQDDISGYEGGVKRLWAGAVNSDRCMLVYENANHNVGGNAPPPEALANFTSREFFDEPVWRKDRLMAINQHFITAFLDLYLKGDESKRSFLRVPFVRSNDGKWPVSFGQSTGGEFANDEKPGRTYWKGFQRRWALGMQMHCAAPGQAAQQ